MPIHLNGAGRLETKLMKDLQPFGDQQLEFGRDALSVLRLVPEACQNDCCSYSCRDIQRILIPEPGMLVVKKKQVSIVI